VDDSGKPIPPSGDADHAQSGRVLVTALHQYATPMVRHDIGDTAALHTQCPGCNLEVPTLSQLRQGA
jgi:phenylacetate-CoA ligase